MVCSREIEILRSQSSPWGIGVIGGTLVVIPFPAVGTEQFFLVAVPLSLLIVATSAQTGELG